MLPVRYPAEATVYVARIDRAAARTIAAAAACDDARAIDRAADAALVAAARVDAAAIDDAARAIAAVLAAARDHGGDQVAALIAVLARVPHPAAYTHAAAAVADAAAGG